MKYTNRNMAPDLPEKLLGIDVDNSETQRTESDDGDTEEPRLRFVFIGLGEHRLAIPIENVHTIAEPPDDLTRVPRSPPAIDGVTDLRGDITVVIDPRAHFSTTEDRSGDERLLVFDRPTDQQSAAIRVDEVIGVETILERNVLDESMIEERELSGRVLDHPLVVALVEQEREPEISPGSVVGTETAADDTSDDDTATSFGSGGATTLSSGQQSSEDSFGAIGETFELAEEPEEHAETAEQTREILVETTAVVDVDKLLFASGHGE